MKLTVDGNTACARIAYAFSDIVAIYPITPSSPMAEVCDEWQAKGVKNLFNRTVKVDELQSEAGVAGAVHGSLSAGALTTTFTASQGLLLMIPNMYKIAGELLPTVFHVSARALATHALSIFGDHADVMACRSTGFAMIASNTPEEAQDMAVVAHLATLKSSVPFLHFFDGFRTSHEIQKINGIEYDDLQKILPNKEIDEFTKRALSSTNPHAQGTAQNPDIYFQNREACNSYYNDAILAVKSSMQDLKSITGRTYNLFDYYGDKNAENVIVLIGSAVETVKQVVDALNKENKKVGVVAVRLYRPFSNQDFILSLPKSVKKIAVLDRTKESGSSGEPLYKDVVSALCNKNITIIGGRYGLGGKEFTPAHAKAVFDNLMGEAKNNFTIGINDDVTHLSLDFDPSYNVETNNYSCKFYGLGSDGTVGANKNSIKIIGSNTDLNAQGYFEYDSKKSGSATISHLRFGKDSTNAPYLITNANFIACHNVSFVEKYDMASDLKDNGIFLLNAPFNKEELEKYLPNTFFAVLKQKNAKLFVVDGSKIAQEVGLGNKINVVMQACFFKLTNIIEYTKVEQLLIDSAVKTYSRKGQKIVDANINAIKNATKNMWEFDLTTYIPKKEPMIRTDAPLDPYDEKFIKVIEHKQGDNLPVSSFDPRGHVPTNTSKYEKRGISLSSPCWISENCIECNMCSMVCPHAAIRPVLVKKENLADAPKSFETKKALGVDGYEFRIQIDPRDCTGCANCVAVCPAKEKALKMMPTIDVEKTELDNYNFAKDIVNPSTIFAPNTIKGSQFRKPYFEFSGACAGCGETPYIKLATQLFGHRMVIANATGCSSIYSGSAPTSPFAKNENNRGPAWANSLFEDNAEFGLGIRLALNEKRQKLRDLAQEYVKNDINTDLKKLLIEWLENFDDKEKSYELSLKLTPLVKGTPLESLSSSFVYESVWCIGGDGWAYDIGFEGLDHVLASGENVNILVLDTEVYSNTGGQMSKSTPLSATAKFATSGKRTPKKDLGQIAMTYKNVYVAQVGLGADMNQCVKAFNEAESYNGPSLIIAYAPCINHGIDMSKSQLEIKHAVDSGYWFLYRYDPRLIAQNKNPFVLDSKKPTLDYTEFLEGETRFKALEKISPALATKLFEQSKAWAEAKYQEYLKLSNNE